LSTAAAGSIRCGEGRACQSAGGAEARGGDQEADVAVGRLLGQPRGRGGIVLLSSIVAFQGAPNAAHYAATKAYVQTLAEGLHAELAPRGVDVLAAAPGPVASGFGDRAGMTLRFAVEPAVIAPRILDALGRRSTTTPGLSSRLLRDGLAPLPRWARTRIMGHVMASMVQPTAGVGRSQRR